MSITEQIDTAGAMGKAITTVMLAFAALERDVLIERTRAGLDAARSRGRLGGRPSVVSSDKLRSARSLIRGGATVTAAAEAVNVSRSSLYRGLVKADGSCVTWAATKFTTRRRPTFQMAASSSSLGAEVR